MPPTACPLLPPSWNVPQKFRDRLGEKPGRQRAMVAEGHLLLVLHAPPTADHDVREGRLFWRSADGQWKPAAMRHGEPPVGELLDEYDRAIDSLQQSMTTAGDSRAYFNILNRLTPLMRAIRNVHRVLQDAREAIPNDRQIILLRDRAYSLARAAELLYDDAKHGLDFEMARREEEQSASAHRMAVSAHRLNVLVAFFFPLATVAGILGMNLKHGLEDADRTSGPWPLVSVLGFGLITGVLLALFVTRKPRV